MPITNKIKYSQEDNGKLSDLIQLGKWKQGIMNRVDEYSVPSDGLLDALNVEIDNYGAIRRRDGYKKLFDGFCHSLFHFNGYAYFVKDGVFCRMNKNEELETLENGYGNDKVYYVEVANELYFCNKEKSNKINRFNNVELWSIKSPQSQCNVVIGEQGSGGFKKGTYRINYSYSYGNYETGIYPLDVVIDVPYDGFNLELSCIPSSQSTTANFYISTANGRELYFVKSGYYVEVDYYDKISKSPKIHSDGIPCLENICFANGRIWGSFGNKIYFTNDRDYRQYNPMLYISVDSTDIVLLKAVDNGVYVVTELATYFYNGLTNPEDLSQVQLVKIFDYSAIKGTLFVEDKTVGWLSREGYIVGDSFGKLENVTKDKIDFSKNYNGGSSLLRKRNGIFQVIFALQEQGKKSEFQVYEKDNEV